MVYESGFTTRRTYSTRPVVSSYSVSKKPPIDWEKCPYVPRPSLITDPVTAFGTRRPDYERRKKSILDPINRAAIKPNYEILHAPIAPYVPARDQNRARILSMVRQHIDTVEAGGNTAARTARDSIDTMLPRLHRAASESLPVRRETYRNEKSGAMVPSSVTRVYKTSYPIYSSYSVPRRVYSGTTRVITSPIRVVTSPTRIISRVIRSPSPVRVVSTTTRVISSPERTYTYTSTPSSYYSSSYLPLSTYYSPTYLPSTYSTYTPRSYVYSSPSYLYSPRVITRSSVSPVRVITSPVRSTPSYLKATLPGYGARALTHYLNTEPFTTFSEETNRIRHRANSLIRDLHTPVLRRARSCTPFPVSGYTYEPASQLALDAYVERITNPVRHVAKEVHRMSQYPRPAERFVGKSHLASVRICGDRAYNIRQPMYDSDKVRTDINLMSWYLRHPHGKVSEKKSIDSPAKEDHELDPNRPSRKFSAPRPLEDEVDLESKEKQRLRQERLLTINENDLPDQVDVEKKRAQRADESNRREEKALEEEKKKLAKEAEAAARKEKEARRAEEARQAAEAEEAARREEEARLAEEAEAAEAAAREAEEARLAKAAAKAARAAEEERLAEEARLAEEQRLQEEELARLAELERQAEEARLAEEQRAHEEELKRLAELERQAEETRIAEEQRIRDEELEHLAQIERQAEEERESEFARQAAELAEIARQESEIAARELEALQQADKNPAATEPLVDEPTSPEDSRQEPIIELSTSIDEVKSDGGNAFESDEEEESEEEEE